MTVEEHLRKLKEMFEREAAQSEAVAVKFLLSGSNTQPYGGDFNPHFSAGMRCAYLNAAGFLGEALKLHFPESTDA